MTMTLTDLQDQCARGQELLERTEYLEAEAVLCTAEREANKASDWDTLARLYMPLQEARRQRRIRCGEGVVCLDLVAEGPHDRIDGRHVVENYPHGQLLVAGWGSIEPARQVRALQREHGLYVEAFLAAVYPVGSARVVVLVPSDEARLPEARPRTREELFPLLPGHCIVLEDAQLPAGAHKGSAETFSLVQGLWERLHEPFLVAADAEAEPRRRIEAYRRTIRVDYACELAHQRLAETARELGRTSAGR